MTYQDEQITIDDQGIIIRNYTFPLMRAKEISWEEIKSIHEFRLTLLDGKFNAWGMTLKPRWFNFDVNRPTKEIAFAINTGSIIQPTITPQMPAPVRKIFQSRGLLKQLQ